jgi:hypothetical protein
MFCVTFCIWLFVLWGGFIVHAIRPASWMVTIADCPWHLIQYVRRCSLRYRVANFSILSTWAHGTSYGAVSFFSKHFSFLELLDVLLCPSSGILKTREHNVLKSERTQRFEKWICFRPQARGWGDVSPITWGWKQIQLPKHCVLWFLYYRKMHKVQKPTNSECYTSSSEEPFCLCSF